jgi:hypothetical protein
MDYLFKGSEPAKDYIMGDGYKVDGWQVETHALGELKPLV